MIRTETYDFLKKLKRNNSREWFNAHRTLYDEAYWNITEIAMYLIDGISSFDDTVRATSPKDSIFRLMRDTRFAADKTPYKTNFGIFIKRGGRKIPGAGYYLHLEPGGSMISGGIYMPPAPQLAVIRAGLAKDPHAMRAILENKTFKKEFGTLWGESVKTAPRGYAKDHPALDLIRYKHFIVGKDVSDADVLKPDFPSVCLALFSRLKEFNQYLNRLMGV